MMRTYSGHSNAQQSNALYRTNLAKGQTGLSIAFDLPTQIGYDPDQPEAGGEVGKVGVPIAHLGHVRQLFEEIPIEEMNTSMTINASSSWIFALYLALAEERGVPFSTLKGTTQNDIVKEYLSRGTFIFPPDASRRLIVDMICYSIDRVPQWNPINICSYHLQEAGATPQQEIAYALATAVGVLDAVRDSQQVPEERFAEVVGRISFFCNAGIRFIEETAKMRAFTALWAEITRQRYGVTDPTLSRFRYGVQVNSLGLTEQQPENNVARIVLESLGVTLSRDARARALQLPAWNEAIGLPRPWDQQWSLRIQQILALETDILEYPDIFEGSKVIEGLTTAMMNEARTELDEIVEGGGVFTMIDELKTRLVQSQSIRTQRIESGELVVVGVNAFTESAPSPLLHGGSEAHLTVDPTLELELKEDLTRWRQQREAGAVEAAMARLAEVAKTSDNIIEATIELARVGGTTGEWGRVLRSVFGEYRAPTGVQGGVGSRSTQLGAQAARAQSLVGGPPRLLVAKPGLDGHSNGAEQIAVAARDAGFEVIYQGIRLTPAEIAAVARDEDVDIVGISILSGSHLQLVPEVLRCLKEASVDAPVIVGGIIPLSDEQTLYAGGVARIYTPKHYLIATIINEMLDLVELSRSQRTTRSQLRSRTSVTEFRNQ
jgi:(2R)-ethylmalonyl-CoA mutase